LAQPEALRVLVLPVASVENHGVLPPESDYLLARCVSARIAGVKGVVVAPPLPYSTALEHAGLGVALGARPTTYAAFMAELLASAARAVDAVVAAVFHGGAYAATYAAAREARRATGGLVAVWSFWDAVARALSERHGVQPYPIHADPVEASLLLACGHREGVREADLGEALAEAERRAERLRGLPAPWLGEDDPAALYPSSPVPASRVLGEELLAAAVDDLAGLIERLQARARRA
jgi:creatinine amidohydrolase/Fe(II)-dependent formamide hydrolase-like protein